MSNYLVIFLLSNEIRLTSCSMSLKRRSLTHIKQLHVPLRLPVVSVISLTRQPLSSNPSHPLGCPPCPCSPHHPHTASVWRYLHPNSQLRTPTRLQDGQQGRARPQARTASPTCKATAMEQGEEGAGAAREVEETLRSRLSLRSRRASHRPCVRCVGRRVCRCCAPRRTMSSRACSLNPMATHEAHSGHF